MKTFQVLQFHIHAPSEHTFDGGKHYDVEVHVVHINPVETKLAVLGIYFDVEAGGNQTNDFITSLQASKAVYNSSQISPKIPLMDLINKLDKTKIYHYSGSLTTPPCSEIVTWIVIHDP